MKRLDVGQILQQAYAALQSEQYMQAEAMCQQALQHAPGLAKAVQLQAMIARKQGQWDRAESFAHSTVKALPEDPECTHLLANILSDQEKLFEASEWYEKTLSLKPDYIQAIQNFGYALLRQQDPLRAASIFEKGWKQDPTHSLIERGLIYALKDSGQYQRVLDEHGETVARLEFALTRGQTLLDLGEFDKALTAFETAMDHPPSRILAFRNVVQVTLMAEGPDAAMDKLRQGLRAYPDHPELYSTASQACLDMGYEDVAFDVLDQGETHLGSHAELHLQRANLYLHQGQGERAYEFSEAALRLRPGDLMIMGTLVRAALMSERSDIAQSGVEAALARDPHNSFWLAMQATVQRASGRPYEGLYDYERFIRVFDVAPPEGFDTIEAYNEALKTALLQQHEFKHHPLSQSVRQGTQTHANLRYLDVPVIRDFFKAIDPAIRDYISQIGDMRGHAFTGRNRGDYRIVSAWSVCLRGEGHHVNHVHPEGWISSAYYVDVPADTDKREDKAGWIKFGEPSFPVTGVNGALGPERIIAPKPGRLVLFPSYMWHGTLPVKDEALRLTLPFDVVPA